MTITDENGDYDVEKILAAGGTRRFLGRIHRIKTVQVATDWPQGDPETLAIDLLHFDGQWYWTVSGNGHCFGPHDSRDAAITSATE
jgi:hypothetical protein